MAVSYLVPARMHAVRFDHDGLMMARLANVAKPTTMMTVDNMARNRCHPAMDAINYRDHV